MHNTGFFFLVRAWRNPPDKSPSRVGISLWDGAKADSGARLNKLKTVWEGKSRHRFVYFWGYIKKKGYMKSTLLVVFVIRFEVIKDYNKAIKCKIRRLLQKYKKKSTLFIFEISHQILRGEKAWWWLGGFQTILFVVAHIVKVAHEWWCKRNKFELKYKITEFEQNWTDNFSKRPRVSSFHLKSAHTSNMEEL